MKKKPDFAKLEEQLRAHAFTYPEATEDFPWGERAIKVNKKAYVFMRATAEELSLSVKLPSSRDMAADLPFAEPTHYGLGKHGWVTAKFAQGDEVPLDLLKAWIDESYRAVAPKKLVKTLDA
ncbi:MAG TPA: MmcQ/YjbR family DNA-binding protein [Thermoanaerobaculia bacterium]|jgi:predicted DNA-binding protein (MmcQ/YjbR family)|nr:MmcQ/YjbR family DNA-binding protein [Thermoanaerobaculia bacterium]